MHQRYRRRFSRLTYSILGVAAGAHSSAMIGAYGPWSWQALLSYLAIGLLAGAARHADRYIAVMARRIAQRPSPTPPPVGPVSGRADW